MSNPMPKEQQSAYQRWEMASFGEHPRLDQPAPPSAATVAHDIEQAREAARQQGYLDGLAQGRAAGAEQERAQLNLELIHLQQLAATFGAEIARANEVIADDMLELSLDISKAMLKTALRIQPQLVLPIVAEAIGYLPSLQQPALLFLHPQDLQLINDIMRDELIKAGWRAVEDASLDRGGCRVETASNQIDASMETRWQRIAAALGKEADWLDK